VSFRPATAPEVFRPRPVLAAAMGTAALLWVFVLVYLMQFEGVPAKTFISAIFFVIFFGVSLTYYARTAIFVDGGGVTYRGMVRTDYFAFGDILKVDILPGPVTVYAVRGRGRGMHFTSFFAHHRRLMELLVERAGLSRMR
jgi:hypothetical protein